MIIQGGDSVVEVRDDNYLLVGKHVDVDHVGTDAEEVGARHDVDAEDHLDGQEALVVRVEAIREILGVHFE